MKRYSAEVLLLSCLKFVIQVPLSFYPSWYGQKSLSLYPVTEKESIDFKGDFRVNLYRKRKGDFAWICI